MKKNTTVVLLALLFVANSVDCGIGAGFSKIWEGTKDVVVGTYDVVTSPFRSKKDGDAQDKKKKDQKKVKKADKKKKIHKKDK